MDYYRLEYNEQQGRFHFNTVNVQPDKFGWKTICEILSHKQCVEFAEWIIKKYPSTNPYNSIQSPRDYPSFELVKQEFIDFLLT